MSLLIAVISSALRAEERTDPPKSSTQPGYRRWLDASGLTLEVSNVLESVRGTHSALRTTLTGDFTDLTVRWNPGALGCSQCGTFSASYSTYAQSRESLTPEVQSISNLSAPAFHRWREAYFEVSPIVPLRIKVGKVDANTEFATMEAAGDLSNASAGVSPTLFLMPSYPDGSLSVNAFLAPGRELSLGGGLYRSAGGGTFAVAEGGRRWRRSYPGRISTGFWHHHGRLLEPETVSKTHGAFLTLEQTLIRSGVRGGLVGFGRYSTADKTVAPASMHAAYGLAWTGIGPRRDDSVGFAYLNLSPVCEGLQLPTEKVFESYYRIAVTRYIAVKIDLQHLQRPGGRTDQAPYMAVSVRLHFKFSTDRE